MGLKTCCKSIIMRRVMKKRKSSGTFDEVQSESFELPEDAAEDMNNSYYFSAHAMDGTTMFLRYAQRGGGEEAVAEVWMAYRAADGTAYVNQGCLYKLSESPARVRCVTPLREWQFSFKGKMTPVKPNADLIARPCGAELDAEFSGVFTSQSGLYEFSRDTDITTFSRAVSAEKWHKGFSAKLNSIHQVHIEQDGYITGALRIGGGELKVSAAAIRDHSYGRRAWSFFNRHTWLISVLEDGTQQNANIVRYPVLNVRGLKSGYKIRAGEVAHVKDISFPADFALLGKPRKSGAYKVKYSDKTGADCEFRLDIAFPFSFEDKEGGYTIYEGVSAFTVNGVKGRGITEFGYNRDKSRYENPACQD